MAQLVRMDARLDTLNDELCQVNTCVGRIARRQVVVGGFTVLPLRLPRHLSIRVTMASAVMMLMRMMMMARLVMMRCLLDKKGGVVLR